MPFDIETVRSQLPHRRIDWHVSLNSTMTEASRLAAEGCASGTVVIADEQTSGRGRHGRAWHSEPDTGLYVSIVLRPALAPEDLPVVTLALGLATVQAIQNITGLACDLRWPNDVLIDSRKCAGILTQMEGPAIIAGIGINVNQPKFPDELSAIATSLRMESGCMHSREHLLVELVLNINYYCTLLERQGRGPIIDLFSRASSFVSGRRVEVDLGDGVVRGTTEGLNDAGFLVLRRDNGAHEVVLAGGVRPCS